MKSALMMAITLALMLFLAAPASAATGANGAGRAFGAHHAEHARDMQGFTGTVNPGVKHHGFSGWTGEM
jgi:hypothetical protein